MLSPQCASSDVRIAVCFERAANLRFGRRHTNAAAEHAQLVQVIYLFRIPSSRWTEVFQLFEPL